VSLTDRDRKIVIAIIPLLLIGVYWFLLLAPKRKEASKLETKVTAAQQAKDAALQQEATLNQAKARFATQYAEMVRLGKAIPTDVDMPSLLVQLESAAKGTGIEFGDIKVGQRVEATPVTSTTTTPSSGTTTTTTPGTSTPSSGSTTTPNVAAGGTPAATSFGKATESANNAAATGNAQAAQQSGLNAGDTATSTAAKPGGLPVGGGSASGATATGTSSPSPTGLDTVPLTFTFGGKFFNLADFFHRLKRFVHVANNKISVQGRLITIDSLKFTSSVQNFPSLEADVSATVYLSPKNGGTTAGATSSGPATSTPGATVQPASTPGTGNSTSTTAPTATLTP
jgi:type IV pilus assembly PilO-like protein